MKSFLWVVCLIAVGCGDPPSKSVNPIIVGSNNSTQTNNSGTNNNTNSACCEGLQCGASPTCADVLCGTCDETSSCSDSQKCEPLAANGPRIVDLSINTTTVTPSTTLTITAIVTDPDGIDDLIGGTLKSPSGAAYGAFQSSAAEGSYQITLNWSQLNAVQPILFDAPITRDIVAEFYDQAGNKVQRSLSLSLACDGANGAACEPGICFDLNTNSDHCGACGNSVEGDMFCEGAQSTCESGDYCQEFGACSVCGDCSNACVVKAPQFGFSFDEVNIVANCDQETTCYADVVSPVADTCIAICGDGTCVTTGARFKNAIVSSSTCMTDWSDPKWETENGAFSYVYCTCSY